MDIHGAFVSLTLGREGVFWDVEPDFLKSPD